MLKCGAYVVRNHRSRQYFDCTWLSPVLRRHADADVRAGAYGSSSALSRHIRLCACGGAAAAPCDEPTEPAKRTHLPSPQCWLGAAGGEHGHGEGNGGVEVNANSVAADARAPPYTVYRVRPWLF